MYDLHGTDLNFVHNRIIGGIRGGLTGGIGGAIGGFVGGGRGGQAALPPTSIGSRGRTVDFRHTHVSSGRRHTHFVGDDCGPFRFKNAQGRCQPLVGGGGGGGCPPGLVLVNGECVAISGPRDPMPGGSAAVMGRYGAAMVPSRFDVMTLDCLPGMVLGKMEADGSHLCYNKKDLTNKERKWPRGTRPLGTPGEMNALRKAASFGRRMETTVKRMQKIGVLKKPHTHRKPPAPRARQLSAGPSIINVE